MVAETYDMTLNDAVKFSIINGIGVFDLAVDSAISSPITMPAPSRSDSKNPLNGATLTATAIVEKKQGDSKNPQKTPNLTATTKTTGESSGVSFDSKNPQNDANLTAASRAPFADIYLLNKNNIIIYNTKLQNSWNQFFQHRKELRKTIKPTQLKMMWGKFNDIIEVHGVDALSDCLDRSVANGWSGVFPPPETQAVASESKGGFNKEDF